MANLSKAKVVSDGHVGRCNTQLLRNTQTFKTMHCPRFQVKTLPANVLAENGHVVGDDESSEYTRCAPVRRSSNGAVQTSDLCNVHNMLTFSSRRATEQTVREGVQSAYQT